MSQVCVEISLNQMNFTGLKEAFAQLPDIKVPEFPLVPDPLIPGTLDPSVEKPMKFAAAAMSVVMKYFKLFILDPIKLLVDQFKNIVAAAGAMFDDILAFMIPQLNVNFMDFISDLIANGSAAISRLIDQVKGVIAMIKPISLPDPISVDCSNPAWEALQKIQACIKESVLAVTKMCMDIVMMVIDKVKEVLNIVPVGALGPPVDALISMLTQMPELINKGWSAVVSMFSGSLVGGDGLAEKMAKSLSEMTAKTEKAMADARDAAGRAVDNASRQVAGAKDAAAKAAMDAQKQLAEQMNAVNNQIAQGKTMLLAFTTQVTTLFGTIPIPGLPDILDTAEEKAFNFYKKYADFVQNWWTSAMSAMMGIFTAAVAELKAKVESILDYVDNLAALAKQIIINAINAITAGLFSFLIQLPELLVKLMQGKVEFCLDLPELPTIPSMPKVEFGTDQLDLLMPKIDLDLVAPDISLTGIQSGFSSPSFAMPKVPSFDLATPKVPSLDLPLPDISIPEIPSFGLPKLSLPDIPTPTLSVPTLSVPDLPTVPSLPGMPTLPGVEVPELPKFDIPEFKLPAFDLAALSIPPMGLIPEFPKFDMSAASLKIPALPTVDFGKIEPNLPDITLPKLPDIGKVNPSLPKIPTVPTIPKLV